MSVVCRFGRQFVSSEVAGVLPDALAIPVCGRDGAALYEIGVPQTDGHRELLFRASIPTESGALHGSTGADLHGLHMHGSTPSRDEAARLNLAREHIDAVGEVVVPVRTTRRPPRSDGVVIAPYAEGIDSLWSDLDGAPPMRLVVHIAEEFAPTLDSLCSRPRVVLRRSREPVPLERVEDVDSACLAWLARQPGRTFAERAGPRQRVMGVVRRPNLDTLENRVLADFLHRCHREAEEYLQSYRSTHASTHRVRRIMALRGLTQRLLSASPIASVPKIETVPVPNYALLFDPRYRQLRVWHERIRRQDDEMRDAAVWQYRVWAERCLTACARALDAALPTGRRSGELLISTRANRGQFVDARSSLAVWASGCRHSQQLVDLIPVNAHSLGRVSQLIRFRTPPDALIHLHPPFQTTPARVICVWSTFSNRLDTPSLADDARRIAQECTAIDHEAISISHLLIAADPSHQLEQGLARIDKTTGWSLITARSSSGELVPSLLAYLAKWLES